MTDFPFIEACFRRPVPHTPVWIMRQAGRYLPEYQKVRKTTDFWGLCETPDLATEVTLQPIDRLGVDAAILFSDILVPVKAMGIDIVFKEGVGPRAPEPFRHEGDLARVHVIDPQEEVPFVYQAIRQIVSALNDRVPLIGFSGAPFTLASYMIEGGGSKNYIEMKTMMYTRPDIWDKLMSMLVDSIIPYLNGMVDAGCRALQIFDSWAGVLSREDYERFALPYTKRVIVGLKREGVPVIHFAVDSLHLLPHLKTLDVDVVGLDWRMDIADCRAFLGDDVAVQGNFDPCKLFGSPASIRAEVKRILDRNCGKPGHVFNLGHGVLPPTNPDHAKAMVDAVHEFSAQ